MLFSLFLVTCVNLSSEVVLKTNEGWDWLNPNGVSTAYAFENKAKGVHVLFPVANCIVTAVSENKESLQPQPTPSPKPLQKPEKADRSI